MMICGSKKKAVYIDCVGVLESKECSPYRLSGSVGISQCEAVCAMSNEAIRKTSHVRSSLDEKLFI